MTEPITPPAAPQEAARVGAPPSPEAVADFADILDALDVHTVPEPTRTGRTNLCGGTGEQVDPLAYDGWSDKPCPGCDACKDVVPETAQPHGLHPFEARRASLIARLYMAGFAKVDGPSEHLWRFDGPNGTVLIPVGHFEDMLDHAERECAKVERATAPPATVEEFLGDLESGDGEPSEGDIQDAYSGRWGQYAEVARLPMSTPTLPPEPTDLAALAARGQPPTAPGPTVAELHAVCLLMQRLGSYGPDASAMLMRLLPVESRRALLEIEAADARGELARARANVVTPPPPEKLAEYAAKVAEIEAKIAALDAGEVRE